MSAPRVLFVVGARPNFVKVAPVLHALERDGAASCELLHTGQHYDWELSGSLIDQLELPEPRTNLGVGSGTHAAQTAGVLVGVERRLLDDPPAAVVVPGDVNSTLAAALAAAKLRVPVVHLEAGLRSGDWTMPEEINRVVTDRVSDLLLCPSPDAVDNLRREGVEDDRIALVGNTMIDSLLALLDGARAEQARRAHALADHGYVLATLHRPALVDDERRLLATMRALEAVAERLPVLLPLHPRTRNQLAASGHRAAEGLRLCEPLEYLDFIALLAHARLVVTDSGGVQEETTALGVPCLTYRTTTERPVTVERGTNRVVGVDPAALVAAAEETLDAPMPERAPEIPLWDGEAGARAGLAIARFLTVG